MSALVVPPKGGRAETARRLLELAAAAGLPAHVVELVDDGQAFSVPDELADRYTGATSPQPAAPAVEPEPEPEPSEGAGATAAPTSPETAGEPPAPTGPAEPRQRKPGRKATEGG